MQKQIVIRIVSVLLLVTTYTVNAQQEPIGFSAKTELSIGTDSNVLRLSADEAQDTLLEIAPELNFIELYGKHRFSAKYEGQYTRFSDFETLNFSEHKGTLNAQFEHSTRLKTNITFKYEDIVELPGLNNSVTQALEEYNKVDQQTFNIKGTYGRDDAAGQAVIQYEHTVRDYTNNNQNFRDYDFDQFVATFFYRVAPNTRLVLEASTSDLMYESNNFNPGSKYTNYLLGAEWRPSVKTRSIVKVGQQNQSFDNPDFNNISGLAYFADVFWRPNTYSLFQIGASRSTRESSEADVGSFITTELTLKFEHEFTPQLNLNAFYSLGEDDIVIRNDVRLKRQQINVKVLYNSAKWLDFFIGIKHFSRDSDLVFYEIKNNQITVGAIGYFSRGSK